MLSELGTTGRGGVSAFLTVALEDKCAQYGSGVG